MAKCGECGAAGKDVVAYCVETNKVMCRKCVGLLHYPGMKSCDFTIEALDKQHPGVQTATVFVMHASVILGMGAALWHSGIGSEYFKGQNTCPALSLGRQGLVRFDANIFYYYKSSLALYCDIEDSFWRLLMDGWLRGVIGGSDSLLLLFSTLPKALLFKTAVSTFLRPVYAVLYALCGILLSIIIVRLEDAGAWVLHHLPLAGMLTGGGAGGGRLSRWCKRFVRLPTTLKQKLTTKNAWPEKARMLFIAIGLSTAIRLVVHWSGFHHLAALGNQEVSEWQLAFEPVCFFFLANRCAWLNAKLGKTVWKKGASTAVAPLTLWRTKPKKDVMELISYTRGRIFRSYNYYRMQAQEILHILVDDIFNLVIVLRVLGIVFGLAPVARQVAAAAGLGPLVERHQQWFQEATGFMDIDLGAKYISDRLVKFGFQEMFVGFRILEKVVETEAIGAFTHVEAAKQIVWRALIPFVLYTLEAKWGIFLKKQQGTYKSTWSGRNWTDGEYAEMLDKYGSYWNKVSKEEWKSPKDYVPPMVK